MSVYTVMCCSYTSAKRPKVCIKPTGLEKLIKSVKEHSDEKGLFLNTKKTKIMDIDKCKKEARIAIDGEEIERVSNFEYLGARIEANGKSTPEIRRRLAMATTRLTKMISIWKGQCKKKKKMRVLETVVFPTALYGCEALTINNTDAKRVTSFEMKCYRKILRMSWMKKVTRKSRYENNYAPAESKNAKTQIFWSHQTP